jgi:hypothetical protein
MDLLDDDSVIDLRPRGRKTDPAAFIQQQRGRGVAVPAENAPLRDWERPAAAPATLPQALGPCVRCGKTARSRCAQCAEAVCAADAWAMLGLCRACVAARMAPPSQ